MNKAIISALILGAALFGGCGEDDDEDADEPVRVSYVAEAGKEGVEKLATIDGLTLEAQCRYVQGRPQMNVLAFTDSESSSMISSEFETTNGPEDGYRFVLNEFDSDFGRWDFLGNNPKEATGTLRYAHPGGYVTIDFTADQGSDQGDCVFNGVAVSVTS